MSHFSIEPINLWLKKNSATGNKKRIRAKRRKVAYQLPRPVTKGFFRARPPPLLFFATERMKKKRRAKPRKVPGFPGRIHNDRLPLRGKYLVVGSSCCDAWNYQFVV